MENERSMVPLGSHGSRPGFISGLLTPWRGFRFLFAHPRLLSYALLPLIINTVLFIIFFLIGFRYFSRWLEALLPQGQAWYWVILTYLLTVILALLLLLVIVFTFAAVANILASPFNDALSARTEALAAGQLAETPFSFADLFKEIGRTIIEELKKIAFYLAAVAILLLLNLVPMAGQALYGLLFTLLTIVWLGLTFLDYALARHGYRLGQKLNLVRRNFRPVFGFGLGVFAGLLIPVFNLLFLPVAVVGGTLLYVDLTET